MIQSPQTLLIGSSVRKAGKTKLACSIIRRFAEFYSITGIKISAMPDNEHRGWRENVHNGETHFTYRIHEEKESGNTTDTARMLEAGAHKAYWLIAENEYLQEGLSVILSRIPLQSLIVCESLRARFYLEPGVFILIHDPQQPVKPHYELLQTLSHDQIPPRKLEEFIENLPLHIQNHQWRLHP